MQVRYSIKFPNKVHAGAGSIERIREWLPKEGGVLVLTDRGVASTAFMDEFRAILEEAAPGYGLLCDLPSEPTDEDVRQLYARVSPLNPRLIVAVGGGSVIDLSKLMAAVLSNPELLEDLLDTSRIRRRDVRLVVVPTTAGSGSEATANAILLFPEKSLKIGILSDSFIPDCVILDPRATVGLPPHLTASTGVDALCHSLESYISLLNNPLSETFALRSFALIFANIERAYLDGSDLEARANMQMGSFLAGVCLTSSCTVAVHALSYPLGGTFRIPHGLSNAILLPAVLEANLDVIGEKLRTLAPVALSGANEIPAAEQPRAVVDAIAALLLRLGIPRSLTGLGVTIEHLDFLSESALAVTRLLDQNPKPLGREEVRAIYQKLL